MSVSKDLIGAFASFCSHSLPLHWPSTYLSITRNPIHRTAPTRYCRLLTGRLDSATTYGYHTQCRLGRVPFNTAIFAVAPGPIMSAYSLYQRKLTHKPPKISSIAIGTVTSVLSTERHRSDPDHATIIPLIVILLHFSSPPVNFHKSRHRKQTYFVTIFILLTIISPFAVRISSFPTFFQYIQPSLGQYSNYRLLPSHFYAINEFIQQNFQYVSNIFT